VLRIFGTTWPSAIPPGLLAAGISIFMGLVPAIDVLTRERDLYMGHPYAFRLFAIVVGSLLVFKTTSAYQRYWEAAGALQFMSSKWLDAVCMAVSFDAGGDVNYPYLHGSEYERSSEPHPATASKGGPDHYEYVAEIAHLCSLLHAVTLQHLRRDENLDNLVASKLAPRHTVIPKSPSFWSEKSIFSQDHLSESYKIQRLPVLGGLRPEEKEALAKDGKGHELPTCARVSMVEGWFMRRMIGRQKFEQGETASTSPPILSRLYQVISDGTLWSFTSSKSAEIPFPFPYQNFVEVMVWLFSFLAPVVINGIIFEGVLRTIATFTVVMSFHALKNTSDVMEDPYLPYDPNDLPLVSWQRSVNNRLLSFGHVPEEPEAPVKDCDSNADSPGLGLEAVEVAVAPKVQELPQAEVREARGKAPAAVANSQGPISASCLDCLPVTFGITHLQASRRSSFS